LLATEIATPRDSEARGGLRCITGAVVALYWLPELPSLHG